MGLKFRLGLGVAGLVMSSLFGTNMLFGIKDYVDTTGNIMVDIADGIAMISTGIEALEHWIDPSGHPITDEKAEAKEGLTPAAPPVPSESPAGGEVPKAAPVDPKAQPVDPKAAPVDPPPAGGAPGGLQADQPAVFCQKGKCYPYDPAKLRNANIELEATPGMILTAPTPTKKPIQKQQSQKGRRRVVQEEDDDDERPRKKTAGADRSQIVPSPTTSTTPSPTTVSPIEASTPSTSSTPTPAPSSSPDASLPEAPAEDLKSSRPVLYGTKKILKAFGGVLQRTSKLLLKTVNKMFPWNRRAKRRLAGEEEE